MAAFLWCGCLPGPDVLPGCLPCLSTTVWDAGVPVIFRVQKYISLLTRTCVGYPLSTGMGFKISLWEALRPSGITEVGWVHLSDPQRHCKANAP